MDHMAPRLWVWVCVGGGVGSCVCMSCWVNHMAMCVCVCVRVSMCVCMCHPLTLVCVSCAEQEIASHMERDTEGYTVVLEAIDTMQRVAWHINDMKRKHEHAVRLQVPTHTHCHTLTYVTIGSILQNKTDTH